MILAAPLIEQTGRGEFVADLAQRAPLAVLGLARYRRFAMAIASRKNLGGPHAESAGSGPLAFRSQFLAERSS